MELSKRSGPAAIVDKGRVQANMQRMLERAHLSGARFRPHFKTHQSLFIGEWCRALGIRTITVSSPEMADFFGANGWKDILIALPMQPGAIDTYQRLAIGGNLELITDSPETVVAIDQALEQTVGLWIEADTGLHRTGVGHWDQHRLVELASVIDASQHFELRGILTHAGHAYACRSKDALQQVFDEQMERLRTMKAHLLEAGFEQVQVSYGDTPCCSVVDSLAGIDELRPGNLVFYDLMQVEICSCTEKDLAMAVACPVIGVYPDRNEVVVHGGAVHLSKENLVYESGLSVFGRVAEWRDDGWGDVLPGVFVNSLSQEHGVIEGPAAWIQQQKVGDVVVVLPVHSCLTMNLLGPDFIEV